MSLRNCITLSLFSLCFGHAELAHAQIDAGVLQRIKNATVLIQARAGQEQTSGSGFVVWSDERESLIATNAHVVAPHLRAGADPSVTCVLNSGQPNERTIRAEIHCVSLVDDLAILRARGERLDSKIEADGNVVPVETQRVYAAGFPFGQALGIGNRNPNVTISETTITSVRLAETGLCETLQTSGGIDPGNSGGPIVDQTGRLLGVSVAKVENSSIGFAVPAWKVQELLPPAMSDVMLTKKPGENAYRCSVNLSGLSQGGSSQIPELMGMRYESGQGVESNLGAGSWSAIEGLRPIPYSMPSEPSEFTFRRHTVIIDPSAIRGSGDQYVFQWRLQTGPNRETAETTFRYSRPLFIHQKQMDQIELALSENQSAASTPDGLPGGTIVPLPQAEDETTIEFDAYIRRCLPAGEGRYLVLWLANDDVVVVDLATKTEIAKINDPSINLIVAGKTSVVTFNKSDRSMTTYQLPDLRSGGTREIRDRPIVQSADWGANTTGPIAAVIQPSGEKTLACVLLDPSSGRISRFALEGQPRLRGRASQSFLDAMPTSGDFQVRMNNAGNVVTLWLNNTSRPQVQVLQKNRRDWSHGNFTQGAIYGYPGPNGNAIFSADAVIADDLGKLHDASFCLPTMHDDFFLTLGNVVMADPRAPRSGPKTTMDPSVEHVDAFTWHLASISDANVHRSWTFCGDLNNEVLVLATTNGLPLEERFICVPDYHVLAAILPEAMRGASKRLRLYDLGEPLPGVERTTSQTNSSTLTESTPSPSQFRTWTDQTGEHTVEATAVAVKAGYVKLEKRDGSTVVLQVRQLSSPDQRWLRENIDSLSGQPN